MVLLCNYNKKRWEIYERWFESKFPKRNPSVYHVDLSSPTNFAEIYENAVKHLGDGFNLEKLPGEVVVVYPGRAMNQSGDNKSAAADLLGFKNYQTLSNWLKRYGVDGTKTVS